MYPTFETVEGSARMTTEVWRTRDDENVHVKVIGTNRVSNMETSGRLTRH